MNQQGSDKCSFLFGALSHGGWWYYFPAAFLVKTPVSTLALIAASLLLVRAGKPLGLQEATFLLVPVLFTFLALTRLTLETGVRYVLPVYPFLFVLASRLATVAPRSIAMAGAILLAVTATAASQLRAVPHQLAYFNELVGGPAEGYRCLSDSNIDWGQALSDLGAYLEREKVPGIYLSYFGTASPEAYGVHYQLLPDFGRIGPPPTYELPPGMSRDLLAISVANLQGVTCADPSLYHWLYERTPVAKLGYAIFVYDLSGDADAHVRLAEIYRSLGPRQFAAAELRKALAIDPEEQSDTRRFKEGGAVAFPRTIKSEK